MWTSVRVFSWSLYLLPLLKGHLYSGEKDTFSGSQNPGLITPWHWPQKSSISSSVYWSKWRQLSKHELCQLKSLHCSCGNSVHNIGEKSIKNFFNTLFSCLKQWLQQIPRQKSVKQKYFIRWLIINEPQPNLHSGDTSIQEILALVPRVSPE